MADLKLTLHVWRQKGPSNKGGFVTYKIGDVSTDSSLLSALSSAAE